MTTTTLEADLTVGDRYYLDGRPGQLINLAATGFANFAFDDEAFATNVQRDELHDWRPCLHSRVELQNATAQETLDRMFGKGSHRI